MVWKQLSISTCIYGSVPSTTALPVKVTLWFQSVPSLLQLLLPGAIFSLSVPVMLSTALRRDFSKLCLFSIPHPLAPLCLSLCAHVCIYTCMCTYEGWQPMLNVFFYHLLPCFLFVFEIRSLTAPEAPCVFGWTSWPASL